MTERVRVSEVLELRRRSVEIDPITEYSLVGVYSFGKGIFHREPLPGGDLGDYRFFRVEPGDLVVSNIQAWEGAIAYASATDAGTIGTHRFLTYTARDDRINTNWARWFFLSEPGMELIRKAAPGTTIRNRTLAIDRFEALEIPLPTIDEQRRVAAQLDRIADGAAALVRQRGHSDLIVPAVPLAVRATLESGTTRVRTRLGDVLELVQRPVSIDLATEYVSIGVRSFGKGVFHYPRRPGAQIGKLRFQSVESGLLVVSNIKAWEGAVATSSLGDIGTVASNRFLFFRPVAGTEATDYFWALLLGADGLGALGQASPGSADRNRTLAVERFRQITLPLPSPNDQVSIGRQVHAARTAVTEFEARAASANRRAAALVPSALNQAFATLGS